MATLSVIMDTRYCKSGQQFPLKVRINHEKKSVYQPLEIDLPLKEWDEKRQMVRSNNPLHKKINRKIAGVVSELQDIILDLEKEGKPFSAKRIKDIYNGDIAPDTIQHYGQRQIALLKESNRFGTARTYRDSLKKLSQFLGGADCRFEELDYGTLTRFEASMLKAGMKVNSVSVYMRSLRAIFNKAVKEGVVDRSYYPFDDFRVQSEKTRSRSLSIDEIKALIGHPLPDGGAKWRFRQLFLFSFAFVGMSFIDMAFLRPSNIVDGRLHYRRRKTGRLYSIGLNEYNAAILHSLAGDRIDGDGYLLPILPSDLTDEERAISFARDVNSRCTKYLKMVATEIGLPPISSYWARYAWANVARKMGYSKDMIAEALGHSYGNRVTSIYLDEYEMGVIDEMNVAVLERVLNRVIYG